MSEEEKFKEVIQEINEINIYLTQQEPTPDYEIEAREKLIEKIKTLITLNTPQVGANMRLFETTLSGLENWDTLDLWFVESELPGLIQNVISLDESLQNVQEELKEVKTPLIESDSKTELETEPEIVLKPDPFDIDEIVSKVSEQFKGEIDGLKQKIDVLKHELDKKEESINRGSSKRIIKTIRPKKNVKLPPPKIKIPVIKGPKIPPKINIPVINGPKTPPKINIPDKIELEKLTNQKGTNSIARVQAQIEEELQKLKITPVFEEESKIEQEPLKEPDSIIDILEESETLPPPPEPDFKLKQPDKSESIFDILEESKPLTPTHEFNSIPEVIESLDKPKESEEPDFKLKQPDKSESIFDIFEESKPLTPTPEFNSIPEVIESLDESKELEEPDLISELIEEIEPVPPTPDSDFLTEIPKEFDPDINTLEELGPLPEPPESDFNSDLPANMPKLESPEIVEKSDQKINFPEPSIIPEKPEELKKSSLISEVSLTEIDSNEKKTNIPFMAKIPKITTVSVEEIDTEYMKSSGTDLFNVFSSVGVKKTQKPVKNLELFTTIPTKEKKEDKKKKKDKNATQFVSFSSPTPESSDSDELKPFSIEELPTDKDSLYQELIALEGKRYSIEKNYKEIGKKFNTGSINEPSYKKQNDELKIKLDEITSRINKIRRFISSF